MPGKIIRQLRRETGLTQRELATRTELTQQCISKYEKKGCNIDYKTLQKICEALNAEVIITRKTGA